MVGNRSTVSWRKFRGEPTAEADQGRLPGFPSFNVVAGGPGSLALAFGGFVSGAVL
jgi:hypothetical protein